MSRINDCLAGLSSNNKKAVVSYIVAGDPLKSATVNAMHDLVESGTDIIELGVPFSDPMAEGPVIQLGHERALENGTSLLDVLDMVAEFRQQDTQTPVVLMGYANPIIAMEESVFAKRAREAGVDGVLVVDLPPEEFTELKGLLDEQNIDSIFLIAPTTQEARIQKIVEKASGYIYYVSLKGVTGAGHLDTAEVAKNVATIKKYTDVPICVGFGIKDAESARQVASCCEGVVVGSVLVNTMASGSAQMSAELKEIVRDIRNGVDNV